MLQSLLTAARGTAGASSCSTLAGAFGAPQGAEGSLLADLERQENCPKLQLVARKVQDLLGQEALQRSEGSGVKETLEQSGLCRRLGLKALDLPVINVINNRNNIKF